MARAISTNRSSGAVAEGIYQIMIKDSEEAVSKEGNDMVVLTMSVIRNGQVSDSQFKDWLTFGSANWKFDQLHDALELEEGKRITYAYYKGKTIYASLIREYYGERINNKIKTYLAPDDALDLLKREQEAGDDGDLGLDLEDVVLEDDDGVLDLEEAPVERAAAKRGRPKQQAVAEMEPDDLDDI